MVEFNPTYEKPAEGAAAAPAHTRARLKRRAGPFPADDVVEVQGQTTDGRFYCVNERGSEWVRGRNLEGVDAE